MFLQMPLNEYMYYRFAIMLKLEQQVYLKMWITKHRWMLDVGLKCIYALLPCY